MRKGYNIKEKIRVNILCTQEISWLIDWSRDISWNSINYGSYVLNINICKHTIPIKFDTLNSIIIKLNRYQINLKFDTKRILFKIAIYSSTKRNFNDS